MSDLPDTPRSHRQPSPGRLFATAVAAALACFVLTLSYGFADHAPAPHGVRLAVAAPAAVVQELRTGLGHAAPGAFTIVPEPSAHAVIAGVRSQSAAGGLVTGATGPMTIVTAGAAGVSQQETITAALTGAATALHRPAHPVDVVPLRTSDRAGLSVFVFELGLLIPSVLGSVGLFLLGRRFRLWWRVSAAVVFSLLAACGSVVALDAIFGALTGASAALAGIGFLGSLTFVAFVTACQAATGLPGTGLAAIAFVFLGNAMSGGTVPFAFLPDGFRQVAPWLPNGAIVSAARDLVYLPGASLGHPLLVLGIWLAGSLAVVAGVDLLHLAARRGAPDRKAEIYATPGTTHLRRRLARPAPARPAPARPALPALSARRRVGDQLGLGKGLHRVASPDPAPAADAAGPSAERQVGLPQVGRGVDVDPAGPRAFGEGEAAFEVLGEHRRGQAERRGVGQFQRLRR
jgi:hypothetical protein